MRKIFTKIIGLALILTAATVSAQDTFTALDGIPGGDVSDIYKDTNGTLYAMVLSDRQVYSSTDNGVNWELFQIPGVTSVNTFYVDGNDLYYFDYRDMYKSTDGGSSWNQVNSQFSPVINSYKAHKSPVSSTTWIVEGQCEGVFVSTDDGFTWTNIIDIPCQSGLDGLYQIAVNSSGDVYFTNRNQGVFRHKHPADGIWDKSKVEQVFAKQTTGTDFNIAVLTTGTDRVYITHRTNQEQFRLISSNTGNNGTFTEVSLPATYDELDAAIISKDFNGNLYLTSYFGYLMFELTDEVAETWQQRTFPTTEYGTQSATKLKWLSSTEVFAMNNQFGLFRSTNDAASWTMRNGSGVNILNFGWASDVEITTSGDIIAFQGYSPRGVWIKSTVQENFEWVPTPSGEELSGRGSDAGLYRLADGSFIVASNAGTLYSSDGRNWQNATNETAPFYATLGLDDVYFFRDRFGGATTEIVYKTTRSDLSQGSSITLTPVETTGLPSSYFIQRLIEHQGDFYMQLFNSVSIQNEIWKIETSGSFFTSQKLNLPQGFDSNNLVGLVSAKNNLYISDQQTIAFSTNQGTTWATFEYRFHNNLLGIDQGVGGIAVAYDGGLAFTQDNGQTWSSRTVPSAYANISDLAVDGSGDFIAGMVRGPVSKYTGDLVFEAAQLPNPIDITWQPLNGPFGGLLDGLIQDSQGNIYAYSRGAGLFKLPAGSSSWERLNTGTNEARIAYVDDNDHLYVADYTNIAKSTDYGVSWTFISCCDRTLDNINLVVANNGNLVVTSTQDGEGLYVSNDNGNSFSKPLGSGVKGRFHELIKSGSGKIWAHQRFNGESTIHTSSDNGSTWQTLGTLDLNNRRVLDIRELEGNTVSVVTDNNIWRTTDDGQTWSSIKGSIASTEPACCPEEFNSPSAIYLAPDDSYYFFNNQDVFKSSDQGQTWTNQTNLSSWNGTLRGMEWRGNDLISSSYNGAIRSVNGTSAFADFNDNLTAVYNYRGSFVPVGNSYFTSPNNGGIIYKSDDDGQSFALDGYDEGYFDGIFKDPQGRIIRHGGGVSVSDDNGITWNYTVNSEYFYNLMTAYVDDIQGVTYYAFRQKFSEGINQFVKSTDLTNWSVVGSSGFPFDTYGPNQFAALDGDVLFSMGYNGATQRNELYRIAGGNAELILIPEVLETAKLQVNFRAQEPVDPSDFRKLIVLYSITGKIAYTEDGVNYKVIYGPPSNDASQFSISENGYYFINNSATGQLWISKDEGNSWQIISGFGQSSFLGLEINPANGFAYAMVQGSVLLKSNNIILEDDGQAPSIVTDGLSPTNGSFNIQISTDLQLTFDELVVPVPGKEIRLFETTNPSTPVAVFDVVGAQLFDDNKRISFTPSPELDYNTQYFVTMEAGAFEDIFGNPVTGITSLAEWSFTTQEAPDLVKPTISLTTSDRSFVKGTPKVFEINATDNVELDGTSAKIWYRKISDPVSVDFKSADMTASGADGPNLDFSVTSLDSWYDAIGLEFYFEVSDKVGNKATLPIDALSANSYFYSYTDYSDSPAKIEGLSFGTTASSYRIMALPFELTDNKISAQFSELGEPNKENFRIGYYNNTKKEFDEYPESLNTISRGRGYWILMKDFVDLEPVSAKAAQNNRAQFFRLTLEQGWNQIGNPYPVPIDWDDVMAQDNNVGQVKVYSNGNFSNAPEGILNPYQGGFVFATARVTDLVVRFRGITTGGRLADESFDLAAENWHLPLAISQGELTNSIGGIGMAPEASAGQDHYDDFNPPTITHRLELLFDNADEAPLARSIVKTEVNQVWSFIAHAEGSDMVSLKWDNSKFGDNDIGLWLYDEERVAFIDMRANAEYKYLAKPAKKFKIYYGDLPEIEVMPSMSLLGEPWPNPTSGQLNIPFAITGEHGEATVSITVFDAQGRMVERLTNKTYQPGTYQLNWQPSRSANQLGLHLIKWNMITENGEQLQETKRVLIK